jgi:hypothetical protein
MNELRNLLLDCRAALRRTDAAFDDGPLRPRLDKTIIAMSTPGPARETVAEPQCFTAQQVAYAWQQAARELHFSHPALYAELGDRVRERLGDTVVDPATELLHLQDELRGAQSTHATLHAELAALHAALADAIALDGADARGSASECALRRVQRLVECANQGAGLPKPRLQRSEDLAPSHGHLQQVSDGTAAFSPGQREWCIGEAVARTGFECTPEQLLAAGDRALAQLLLGDALTA